MPSTLPAGDKLDQLAIATNEKMRRDAQMADLREVRMGGGVEPIGKQVHDTLTTELCRWQTDGMENDQRNGLTRRTFITMGRFDMPHAFKPAVRPDFRSCRPAQQGAHSSIPSRSIR